MNKNTISLALIAMIGGSLVSGCATSNAPLTASGKKIEILVVSNRGKESEMESKQWRYRNEVGGYMEEDLLHRLNQTGYNARLIRSKSEFTPAEGRYLVYMEIKSYNPGSSAARMLVGFGAGACSLDMSYIVFDGESKKVMEWDDGVGTSGDWRRIPRELNDRLARKLNTKLATL